MKTDLNFFYRFCDQNKVLPSTEVPGAEFQIKVCKVFMLSFTKREFELEY